MSKRFTDSEKWKNPWFYKLPNEAKLAWVYLLDNCDIAGCWAVNLDLLSHHLGIEITADQLWSWFKMRISIVGEWNSGSPLGERIWIPAFIDFQYGKLSRDCKPHLSVLKLLERYQIDPTSISSITVPKGLAKGMDTLKDKDKDKEKNKDKDQEKEKEKDMHTLPEKKEWNEKLKALSRTSSIPPDFEF